MKKRYGNELHPLYPRWLSMTQRCNNPKHVSYKNYGAKGITVSTELQSFEFYRDYVSSLAGYDPINAQVDRIDPTKNYEIGNLRWTTQSVQIANQTNSGKGSNNYTGVNWSKTHNRWVARINLKGKTVFTKVCLSEKEAYDARVQYIKDNNLPHFIQPWLG